MFTLISIGVGTAYLYSLLAFPSDLYFEAAAVITTLVLIGQVLEQKGRSNTRKAIQSLIKLAPEEATLIQGSQEKKSPSY